MYITYGVRTIDLHTSARGRRRLWDDSHLNLALVSPSYPQKIFWAFETAVPDSHVILGASDTSEAVRISLLS
jgi:hypothetical protein